MEDKGGYYMRTPRLAVSAILGVSYLVFQALAIPVAPAHVTYGDDARSQVTVSWRTVAQAASTVQYGTTTAYGSTATGSSFLTGGAYQHHVRLTGLAAGTLYYYGYEGRQATFRTAPATPQPFTFIVPGDIQGWPNINPSWQGCANWLAANKDAAFWVPVGDLIGDTSQVSWDYLYRSSAALVQKSVMMPVMGNHDCNGSYPQKYLDQFRTPSNGNATFANTYYAFEYGDALIVVMLNNYETDTWFPGAKAAQTTWLQQTLSASAKQWKYVFMHDPDYLAAWATVMDQNGVDVVFLGHTHIYDESWRGSTFLYTTAGFSNEGTDMICVAAVNGSSMTVTTYNWRTGAVLNQTALGTPSRVKGQCTAGQTAARRGAHAVFEVAGPSGLSSRARGSVYGLDGSAVTGSARVVRGVYVVRTHE
jgi:hypothetical protein